MSRCRGGGGGVIPKRGPGDVRINARSGTISRHPRCLALNDIPVFVGSGAPHNPVCTILLFFCFLLPHFEKDSLCGIPSVKYY